MLVYLVHVPNFGIFYFLVYVQKLSSRQFKYICCKRPILSGFIGRWAYALIEYHFAYESLRTTTGQVIADFIVDHKIKDERILITLVYAHI